MTIKQNRLFYLIVGIGLLIRLAVWIWIGFDREVLLTGDGKEFNAIAENLVLHGRFASETPDMPDIRRTPVYPVWIALIRFFTGSWYHPAWVTFTHLFFYVLTAFLIYSLMRKYFNENIALIALILFCLDISGIGNGTLLMAETLYALFLMLFVFFLSRYTENWKPVYALGSGFFAGMMSLTKPMSFYFLFFVLPLVVFLIFFYKLYRKKIFTGYFGILLGFIIIVSPWIFRNYHAAGVFQISSIQDYQLLFYQSAIIRARSENISREEAVARIREEMIQTNGITTDLPESAEQLKMYREKAWQILSSHPGMVVKHFLIGRILQLIDPDRFTIATLLYGYPGEGFFNRSVTSGGLWAVLVSLWNQKKLLMILTMNFLILFAASIGLIVFLLQLRQYRPIWPFLGILLVLFFLHWCITGLTPWARFRVMFFPLIAMLAAPGLWVIGNYVKTFIHKKFCAH